MTPPRQSVALGSVSPFSATRRPAVSPSLTLPALGSGEVIYFGPSQKIHEAALTVSAHLLGGRGRPNAKHLRSQVSTSSISLASLRFRLLFMIFWMCRDPIISESAASPCSLSRQLQMAGVLPIFRFKFEAGYSLWRALASWTRPLSHLSKHKYDSA